MSTMRKNLIYLLASACMLSYGLVSAFFSDLVNPFDFIHHQKWKKDMEGKVNAVFAIVIPKSEQDKWILLNDKIVTGDINEYALGSWIEASSGIYDGKVDWSEKFTCQYEYLPIAIAKGEVIQHETISHFIEVYKKRKLAEKGFQNEVILLETHGNEAFFEVRSFEQEDGIGGRVGGLPKKEREVIQEMSLERWILADDWLIHLQYRFRPLGGSEDGVVWNNLRKTWFARLSSVTF